MFQFQVPDFKDATPEQIEDAFRQWYMTSNQHDLDWAIQTLFDERQRQLLEQNSKASERIQVIFDGRWLQTARRAMYLSGANMAGRLGIKPPTCSRIENSEKDGNITLRTMKTYADAMGCEFVYFLRPATSQTFARTVWDAVSADAASSPRVRMATEGSRVRAMISVVREELEKRTSRKKPKVQRYVGRYSPAKKNVPDTQTESLLNFQSESPHQKA